MEKVLHGDPKRSTNRKNQAGPDLDLDADKDFVTYLSRNQRKALKRTHPIEEKKIAGLQKAEFLHKRMKEEKK